jgi:hypothetical protein
VENEKNEEELGDLRSSLADVMGLLQHYLPPSKKGQDAQKLFEIAFSMAIESIQEFYKK